MRKNKLFKRNSVIVGIISSLGIMSSMASMNARADLYVSPVTKDSASVNYVNNVVNGKAPATNVNQQGRQVNSNQGFYQSEQRTVNNELTPTGNVFAQAMQQDSRGTHSAQQGHNGNLGYEMSVYNQAPVILMNQGKDIPLFVAVEGIVPDISSWMVHYDEGMHNLDMTWSGGDTWEGVLHTLGLQNKIFVEINHAERVIGLGNSANIAKHLAKKVPTVWRVDTSKSLRENLTEWSEKAGWELAWDSSLMIDYPVNHNAVFTGDLVGKDGAVDSILSSYKNADIPLKVKFYKKNKVVLVTRGGFEQELSY
jgi:hypothetical protein